MILQISTERTANGWKKSVTIDTANGRVLQACFVRPGKIKNNGACVTTDLAKDPETMIHAMYAHRAEKAERARKRQAAQEQRARRNDWKSLFPAVKGV